MRAILLLCIFFLGAHPASAQPKRIPPPGIPVPTEVREKLGKQLLAFQTEITNVLAQRGGENSMQLFPDVQVYEKAVRYALEHDEFYRTNEFEIAEQLLAEGNRRLRDFKARNERWLGAKGLLVRGYQSRIDGSVQPYGLIVPESYRRGDGKRYRLDVWLHGRDEKLTELKFMHERATRRGEFAPADTFVLHPYGRYCNAFKFAGESDVFEALQSVQEYFSIDASRIVLRGFSMGGAGVWHLATHHAYHWVCAAPGAGFAESAEYLRLKPESRLPFERVLWQWYDAPDYALNLYHCPTIAYSGELDKQRQAADVMERALRAEGLPLVHLIGPKTEHKYHAETKHVLETLVDAVAAKGKEMQPSDIRFTTRTLQYPKMHWIMLLGLEKHWVRADVRAKLMSNRVTMSVTNVRSFMFHEMDARTERNLKEVEINGQRITNLVKAQDTAYFIFVKTNGLWSAGGSQAEMIATTRKGMGHQGPIDDAFSSPFVFVPPDGNGFHDETSSWIGREFKRAVYEWRAQFRGDVQVVNASEVKDWTQNNHLVLWGDPQSNEVIREILQKLPLKWTAETIEVGGKIYDARKHVPLMIFPNPLAPDKYVVLNSGFTFRGFGSNADQTAKLPDYAMLDISKDDPFVDGIVTAGFFNEEWELE
ncbi:MAG TPA: hypothetical protein VF773_13600 [Verrucomicrobiae bacterium]